MESSPGESLENKPKVRESVIRERGSQGAKELKRVELVRLFPIVRAFMI